MLPALTHIRGISRRMSRPRSAATPCVRALRAAGVAYREHSYEHDPAADSYGLEAAAALGVAPDRVYKTLVVDAAGRLAVGVVPVSATLDLRAIGTVLRTKGVSMADLRRAERTVGYVAGGISPLGMRRALATVVDASALSHPTVFVSGGRRGLDVELDPRDLVRLTDATVAAIASARSTRHEAQGTDGAQGPDEVQGPGGRHDEDSGS